MMAFAAPGTFNGVRVIESVHALRREKRFPWKPATKRRMRRVIGKYGSWHIHVPCAYSTPAGLVVHPVIMTGLRNRCSPLPNP